MTDGWMASLLHHVISNQSSMTSLICDMNYFTARLHTPMAQKAFSKNFRDLITFSSFPHTSQSTVHPSIRPSNRLRSDQSALRPPSISSSSTSTSTLVIPLLIQLINQPIRIRTMPITITTFAIVLQEIGHPAIIPAAASPPFRRTASSPPIVSISTSVSDSDSVLAHAMISAAAAAGSGVEGA